MFWAVRKCDMAVENVWLYKGLQLVTGLFETNYYAQMST